MITDTEELKVAQAAVRRWAEGAGFVVTDQQCAQCAHAVSEAVWTLHDKKQVDPVKAAPKPSKDSDK